jgi:hypothetical protein
MHKPASRRREAWRHRRRRSGRAKGARAPRQSWRRPRREVGYGWPARVGPPRAGDEHGPVLSLGGCGLRPEAPGLARTRKGPARFPAVPGLGLCRTDRAGRSADDRQTVLLISTLDDPRTLTWTRNYPSRAVNPAPIRSSRVSARIRVRVGPGTFFACAPGWCSSNTCVRVLGPDPPGSGSGLDRTGFVLRCCSCSRSCRRAAHHLRTRPHCQSGFDPPGDVSGSGSPGRSVSFVVAARATALVARWYKTCVRAVGRDSILPGTCLRDGPGRPSAVAPATRSCRAGVYAALRIPRLRVLLRRTGRSDSGPAASGPTEARCSSSSLAFARLGPLLSGIFRSGLSVALHSRSSGARVRPSVDLGPERGRRRQGRTAAEGRPPRRSRPARPLTGAVRDLSC